MDELIIKLKALKVTQPIGDFFIAKIPAKDLVEISYSDIRSLSHERDIETYLGIQRPLNLTRAKEIKEYVKNIDASFPSAIILSIDGENINWDDSTGVLEILNTNGDSPAKILDGQHRIAGFMDVSTGKPIDELCYFIEDGEKKDFELILTIFVGLDLTEQATIFATVNLKQTKVNKSLVYDLEAYANARSPQKTSHDITIILDNNEKSPFKDRIKRLGLKTGVNENISQATFVEELISLISDNPMIDRDTLLRKEKKSFSSFRNGLKRTDYSDDLIFRNYFIDNKDDEIIKVLFSFFLAVEKTWPLSWDVRNKISILNKTVGLKALFKVLKDICKKEWRDNEDKILDIDFFLSKLRSCDIPEDFFSSHKATSSSINTIYKEIIDGLQ